jgi:ferredoxin
MARTVTLVAEIVDANCTGCDLCVKVCPTIALAMRDRKPSELGPGKRIAVVDPKACYNVQNCVEICPHEAIVMRELEKPFHVQTDVSKVDPAIIASIAAKAGFSPEMRVCICTETSVAEIAAAIVLGADTPEKVSLATGARTGCTEICAHGVLALLAAGGHPYKPPQDTGDQFQLYDMCSTLWEKIGADGSGIPQVAAQFPAYYDIGREVSDLGELRSVIGQTKKAVPVAEPDKNS